ncbi:MAG: GNAT family N-acetyltransferase [Tenacibaculum sp.]|nr:GNAT family N-acetyltransferase [Tenacibaculum sp.]
MKKQDFNIKTKRLTLKLVSIKDAKKAFKILVKYPQITDHLTFLTPKELSETEGYFSFVNNLENLSELVWGIFYEDEFIGQIGLHDIVYESFLKKRTHDSANFGYWLSPEYQGKGIMTEASKAVLAFGFEKLNLHRIYAKHIDVNKASGNVLIKCGFKFIGTDRHSAFYDGKWWDEKLYDLFLEELKK